MGICKQLVMKLALVGMVVAVPAVAFAQNIGDPCANSRDIKLTNGKIVTMDSKNSIVAEVTIQDGWYTAVGKVANERLNPCTKIINLRGRTVVPGLIDNHNHLVLFGM